jgi:hypothetical protein
MSWQYLDTTHDPVALYSFDGDMLDRSGNSRDLTVEAGVEAYSSQSYPSSLNAFRFNGSTNLIHNTAVADIRVTGSCTIMFAIEALSNAGGVIVDHGVPGAFASSTENSVYEIAALTTSLLLRYFHEWALGVDVSMSAVLAGRIRVNTPHLVAVVRDDTAGTVSLWIDGRFIAELGSFSDPPSDGANGRLRVGGYAGSRINAMICSLAIYDFAMTEDQIVERAQFVGAMPSPILSPVAPFIPEQIALIGDLVIGPGRLSRLVNLMNWVAANRPQTHINEAFGREGVAGSAGSDSVELGVVVFESLKSTTVVRARVNISADHTSVRCGFSVYVDDPADTIEITFSLGGVSQSMTITGTASNGQNIEIDFGSVAPGWQNFQASTEWLDASMADPPHELRSLRLQEIVPDFYPSPSAEP